MITSEPVSLAFCVEGRSGSEGGSLCDSIRGGTAADGGSALAMATATAIVAKPEAKSDRVLACTTATISSLSFSYTRNSCVGNART